MKTLVILPYPETEHVRLAIIGAGISGLSCADRLREAGFDLVVFDKARGPGGRMATRRVETAQGIAHLDHGAQYFTVRDDLCVDIALDRIAQPTSVEPVAATFA